MSLNWRDARGNDPHPFGLPYIAVRISWSAWMTLHHRPPTIHVGALL